MLLLAPAFFEPLRDLAAAWHDRAAGEAALDALARLAGSGEQLLPGAGDDPSRGPPGGPSAGPPTVVVQGLAFAYPGAAQPVLDGFDLGVAAGERVALFGPSGGGKTTLLALVAGLAAPQAGTIAVGGEARWPDLPAVPTVAESGYPGYRSETMQALFAPAGTPAAAVRRFGSEVRRILALPAVRKQAGDQGFEVVASTPEALAVRVADEAPRWAEVAAAAHIRVD
ncbi:MAG: hypothetical protein ABT00_12765 [Bordetella sp. SCN 68-11]|nr:MAG: hypothetical protein ABT00_12765 [Bordetella sp. SCN 68-11]